MLQALSSLTNDGTTLKPYVVDKIVDNNGTIIYDGKREELEKVYSKETIDYIKKLMHNVVYDGLVYNKVWQPSSTTLIGKTGTAQIASPNGGYLKGENDYVRSFAGVFPEEDPKYIVYIAAKQINTSATNIAKEFTSAVDKIVSYAGLVNNKDEMTEKIIYLDNYISSDVTSTIDNLTEKQLNVIKLGTGNYIINQYPLKGIKLFENSKVFLVTNNTDYIMEDITNWSLNEVMTYSNLLGIELNVNGYGYVKEQSIPVETPINKDMILTVTLSDEDL